MAPIVISVYDRLTHLIRCVESLKENKQSILSHLYVISDAPAVTNHRGKITEVRNYAKTISGFRQVTLVDRDTNLGSYLSIKSGIELAFQEDGRVIFIEDDNVVGKRFLEYMNNGLNCYRDRHDIFSVCGYSYPVDYPQSYENDVYLWKGFSAWGVGLWREKWEGIDFDFERLAQKSKSSPWRRQIANVMPVLPAYIDHFVSKGIRVADAAISCQLIEEGRFSLFPTRSMVRNLGHDGSGEHCGETSRYKNQEIDDDRAIELASDISPSHLIDSSLKRHFTPPIKQRVKLAILGLLRRLR